MLNVKSTADENTYAVSKFEFYYVEYSIPAK